MTDAKFSLDAGRKLSQMYKASLAGTLPGRNIPPRTASSRLDMARNIEPIDHSKSNYSGVIIEGKSDTTPTGDELEERKVLLYNFQKGRYSEGVHHLVEYVGTADDDDDVERPLYRIVSSECGQVEIITDVTCNLGTTTYVKKIIWIPSTELDDPA